MKTGFLHQLLAAGLRFRGSQPPATLEQGHLGGEMAAFADLHSIPTREKVDKI
jgi:hypothetical protein